jgi:hypothetical protein
MRHAQLVPNFFGVDASSGVVPIWSWLCMGRVPRSTDIEFLDVGKTIYEILAISAEASDT